MTGETQTYYYDGLQLRREDWSNSDHSFIDLVGIIGATHDTAQTYAVKAINRVQTMRNWLIGYYIIEFEQNGKDRADYGSNLLQTLEEKVNRKGLNITLFKNARRFYVQYPQIAQLFFMQNSPTVSDKWIETKSSTVSDFLADTHKTDSASKDPGAYWRKLKQRLKKEGSEIVTCHGLKWMASDGKHYKTDCFTTADTFRLIQSIPSPKAEPFKVWMAPFVDINDNKMLQQ